jgi:hypothetical protein
LLILRQKLAKIMQNIIILIVYSDNTKAWSSGEAPPTLSIVSLVNRKRRGGGGGGGGGRRRRNKKK